MDLSQGCHSGTIRVVLSLFKQFHTISDLIFRIKMKICQVST